MSASGFPAPIPYFPPIFPWVMPWPAFDGALAKYGTKLTWQRSHLCPCVYAGETTGSPDPQCKQCLGLGWYWDAPSDPFQGLITFVHMSPSPDEPGAIMDEKFGVIEHAEPTLTIPFTASIPYASGSLNDVYVQVDTQDRYETQLQVSGVQAVPYQQNLNIPPSGAVTVYDPVNHVVDIVSGYVVSGQSVILPPGYASGTPYIVSYTASKAFVAWRAAGSMAHDRPFGSQTFPKRFRLQALDLWLRGSGKI